LKPEEEWKKIKCWVGGQKFCSFEDSQAMPAIPSGTGTFRERVKRWEVKWISLWAGALLLMNGIFISTLKGLN
jgi:hypothetical protein